LLSDARTKESLNFSGFIHVSEISTASLPISGDNALLASRYISALFALAEQDGVVDTVVADMLNLRRLWQDSPEWRFIATDSRLNLDSIRAAAEQVAQLAGVSTLTSNFLSVIAQNRRLNLLPLLIESFIDEVGTRRGEFRADVRSARPLTDEQREKLATLLAVAAGGKVRLSVVEDASIIGGITVKIGSQLIDASVKTKLDLMERTLKETSVAA
jgi:F-type H+-transporting ATPase subunit delta